MKLKSFVRIYLIVFPFSLIFAWWPMYPVIPAPGSFLIYILHILAKEILLLWQWLSLLFIYSNLSWRTPDVLFVWVFLIYAWSPVYHKHLILSMSFVSSFLFRVEQFLRLAFHITQVIFYIVISTLSCPFFGENILSKEISLPLWFPKLPDLILCLMYLWSSSVEIRYLMVLDDSLSKLVLFIGAPHFWGLWVYFYKEPLRWSL